MDGLTLFLIATGALLAGRLSGYLAADISSKTIMQMVVSLAILATSLYIIISHSFNLQDKHWAYASAGTILGFWLRGSK